MSRTLFLYIFKDLIRIFILTSGALAGIMSFGGLLRPLTQNGLDAGQVGKILTYFMPAMSTYSLPVAALFATTMVYGRLSGDNELTAMRASGISYIRITYPAIVLGLVVSLISLLFLCFIVPVFTLKVEKVIYSNLAKIVANSVERTHEIKGGLDKDSVHAEAAYLQPANPIHPHEQCVVLIGATIVGYDRAEGSEMYARFRPAKDFLLARKATLYITQEGGTDEVQVRIIPEGGTRFSRRATGGDRGGVEFIEYGPITMPSPIKENPKFMVLSRLHDFFRDPGKAQAVTTVVQKLILRDQERAMVRLYAAGLLGPEKATVIRPNDNEDYVIHTGDSVVETPKDKEDEIIITAKASARLPRIERLRDGQQDLSAEAAQIILKVAPDPSTGRVDIEARMASAIVRSSGDVMARNNYPLHFSAAMPTTVANLRNKTAHNFLADEQLPPKDHLQLKRELIKTTNSVIAEMNNRASFAVSCIILVMVGCALGIMFRSGNFLTAFAVSVIPALLSIVLIVTGQHTCENIPYEIKSGFHNPLSIGLTLIWSGNLVVLVIATVLLTKLQRR
jgi:lipopolysaccharide export LptBFGC system permease protein LptF